MSITFSPSNSALYFVGTEDGTVHYCSSSYSDSFLQSFKPHMGPVFQLSHSPFSEALLLSCSSDWKLCLWHADNREQPFVLQPNTSAVVDAAWSHHHPGVLASISEERLDLWNLCERQHDPVFSLRLGDEQTRLSRVDFNPEKPILAVGLELGRGGEEKAGCVDDGRLFLTDLFFSFALRAGR